MLKMQDVPVMNSRGMQEEWILHGISHHLLQQKKIHQQPASENETRALIRIFQEYGGRGLLVFCGYGKRWFITGGIRIFPLVRDATVLHVT
mgnify:CR=1 FL=1